MTSDDVWVVLLQDVGFQQTTLAMAYSEGKVSTHPTLAMAYSEGKVSTHPTELCMHDAL